MRPHLRGSESPQRPTASLQAILNGTQRMPPHAPVSARMTPEPMLMTPGSALRSRRQGIKQQRLTKACDHCHRRKIRCDGRQPCERCQHLGVDCLYTPSMKKRGPKPRSATPGSGKQQQSPTYGRMMSNKNQLSSPLSSSTDATKTRRTRHYRTVDSAALIMMHRDASQSADDGEDDDNDTVELASAPSQFDLTQMNGIHVPAGDLTDFELAACEFFLNSTDLGASSQFMPVLDRTALRRNLHDVKNQHLAPTAHPRVPANLRDAMTAMTTHSILLNQQRQAKKMALFHSAELISMSASPAHQQLAVQHHLDVDPNTVQRYWDQLLDSAGWRSSSEPSISAVQSALIIAMIAICRGNTPLAWRSVNNAWSEATLLGLDHHDDTENRTEETNQQDSDFDRECRQRCWWGCVYLKQLLVVAMNLRASLCEMESSGEPLPNPLFSCDGSDSCPVSDVTTDNCWTTKSLERLDDFGVNILLTNELFTVYKLATGEKGNVATTDADLAEICEHARQIRRCNPTGSVRDVSAIGLMIVTHCPSLIRLDLHDCHLNSDAIKLALELSAGVNALTAQMRIPSPLCSLFVFYGAYCHLVNILTSTDKKSAVDSAKALDVMLGFLRKSAGFWYTIDQHVKFLESTLSENGITASVEANGSPVLNTVNYKPIVEQLMAEKTLPLGIVTGKTVSAHRLQQRFSQMNENPLFDYVDDEDQSMYDYDQQRHRSATATPVTVTGEITHSFQQFTLPGVSHSTDWDSAEMFPPLSVDHVDALLQKHPLAHYDADDHWDQ